MSLLSRLFGRTGSPEPSACAPPRADRIDVHRGFDVAANADIVTGYRFFATMQLRTPLRVLRRHGEIHHGTDNEPPEIAREMWEGIWLPEVATFRELGLDVDEIVSTMASDIGQIPQDGGEYLRFLIALRTAAEGVGSADERRAGVALITKDPQWCDPVGKLGGEQAVLDRLFPPFMETVPRMPTKTAAALAAAGYGTPAAVDGATDQELRAVQGVGPALVTALRTAAGAATDRGARYVDRVTR